LKGYNRSRRCAEVESTSLPKPKVAIYGLTTEGYSVASKIVDVATVTIVDDTLQMAMDLTPQLVRGHPSLQELVGGESLMGLRPIPQVLSEAKLVFFSPKLRKTGDESIIESSMKVREVAGHVSKGSTIVNTLPMGIGGNSDNIAVIEKQTGMKIGETINYGYCPLRPRGQLGVIALSAKMREALNPEEIGLKSAYGGITSTELSYVSSVINESAAIAVEVELMRKARTQKLPPSQEEGPVRREGERFIDDLASFVYDLTAVQASEDVGEPLTYMAGAALRSLENDVRYIVEETRELLREMQLKASRTKVLVAWTIDRYEMRADRLRTAEGLVERLRDYVTDVRHVQTDMREEATDPFKHNVVIACSAKDRDWIKGLRKAVRAHEMTILNATPSLTRE
jgi:hypothetical protein